MGVSLNPHTNNLRSLRDNISAVKQVIPLRNGYFGEKGNETYIRRIYVDDPTNFGIELYKLLSIGSMEEDLNNGKVKLATLADGTIISFRLTTKSDDFPGIMINTKKSSDPCGIKFQKIHFMKKGESNDSI